jgi:hypothetical protein
MIKKKLNLAMAPRGVFFVFTLLSTLAVSGCGDKNERVYPGLQVRWRNPAVCGCIWDELKTKYTHGELEKMNQQVGYVPPRFMDNMLSAAQQCRK